MRNSSARQNLIRRKRELRTIRVMLGMYCRGNHAGSGAQLCADCDALFDYATRRLERCVFGDAKPTCANCAVHCYSADKREQIREVMQWAGPRMLLRHPLLAIFHLLDGRRPAPGLPAKPAKSEARAVSIERSQRS
ncbi:MAG: nitrous oxide-stimulated promoter family protein [Proteobacteria bacterium]|nr:nitrous oxide-stimulated promoter family protein [Pseudomonadota bacterium]